MVICGRVTEGEQCGKMHLGTSKQLCQVLRKYSDKTVARDLVRELESYAGDPTNLVMSGMCMSARSYFCN